MRIVPEPYRIKAGAEGFFEFSSATEIACALPVVERELFFLDFESGKPNTAEFRVEKVEYDYILTVSDKITVTAPDPEGLFHGAMTLKQMIFEYYREGISLIPHCTVTDKPRFGFRGFMIDVCRHFFPVATIKKIIDAIALVKMNKLHFHLSEDQGFRLTVDAFPKLAEVGSRRAQTRDDGAEHKGCYSKAEIADLVAYAAERFVEIIPEIDLPGHTQAMIAAYPELGCDGKPAKVSEHFGIHGKVLCAGKESTYDFVLKLLEEVAELFPCEYFHIGGDEVPKLEWAKCPDCNALLKREGFDDYEKLQGYFTNRIVAKLKELGKTPVTWNEALYSGMLDGDVVVQYWADGAGAKRVCRAANEGGRRVIVSKLVPYYLDYPCGLSSLKAAYNFEPVLKGMTEEGGKGVIGVETPLWTEYVETEEKLFERAFPRALAVAERGWSSAERDYAGFTDRLENVLGILQACDIGFTPVSECNPGLFKRASQMIAFAKYAKDDYTAESARLAKESRKAAKSVHKSRPPQ